VATKITGHVSGRQRRKGIAVTETAILIPAFALVAFATIECSNALYLQQSLTLAAYEAGAILSEPTGTVDNANARCIEILQARDVTSYTLVTSPDLETTTLSPGDIFTVIVSAPASAYSIGPSWFFQNRTLTSEVHMVRSP
jgi:hypothetical protein